METTQPHWAACYTAQPSSWGASFSLRHVWISLLFGNAHCLLSSHHCEEPVFWVALLLSGGGLLLDLLSRLRGQALFPQSHLTEHALQPQAVWVISGRMKEIPPALPREPAGRPRTLWLSFKVNPACCQAAVESEVPAVHWGTWW